jgi:hypothetical protein
VLFRYPGGDFELWIPELRVDAGEHVAVIGPSGSGKTTLLHLVAGIAVPEAGSVETAGVDVTRASDAERRAFRIRRLGLVFQEFELLELGHALTMQAGEAPDGCKAAPRTVDSLGTAIAPEASRTPSRTRFSAPLAASEGGPMGHGGHFPSQAAAAHAMAWLEMGDFGAVRRHKDGRIYVELSKAGGGERRIWSQAGRAGGCRGARGARTARSS